MRIFKKSGFSSHFSYLFIPENANLVNDEEKRITRKGKKREMHVKMDMFSGKSRDRIFRMGSSGATVSHACVLLR